MGFQLFFFFCIYFFIFTCSCDLPYDLQGELQAASLTTLNKEVVEQVHLQSWLWFSLRGWLTAVETRGKCTASEVQSANDVLTVNGLRSVCVCGGGSLVIFRRLQRKSIKFSHL